MKFAICNETFKDWPFDRAMAYARDLGYEGIEFAPFTMNKDVRQISKQQREIVRGQAESVGLEVIGLHWLLAFTEGYYLTSPDKSTREATTSYLQELAKLCSDLGGKILVLGSPAQRNLLPGVSHDQAMEYAAEVIGGATSTLADLGVCLAVEPLGPEEGDFLLTAELGRQLIDHIDSPTVRLHLDVKAMSSEPTPIEQIIRESADYMVHFHANDANKQGPGMGEIDFRPILQTLKEVDYQGWVSVEVFDYDPGVERLASESIANLRDCMP